MAVTRDQNVLKVGHTEMETKNAALYESYSALACLTDRLLATTSQNTAQTPENFFEHLTAVLTGPAFEARVDELEAHFTCIDGFLGARAEDRAEAHD